MQSTNQSFEDGTFPEDDGWSISFSYAPNFNRHHRGLQDPPRFEWHVSNREAEEGIYSIKTPEPLGGGFLGEYKLIFTTPLDWPDGFLHFSILSDLAGFSEDRDWSEVLKWYVDGAYAGNATDTNQEWESFSVYLEPGQHEVTWECTFNAPSGSGYSGPGDAFLDTVYFVPSN